MQHVRYEIGRHFDEKGNPLVVVDGKIFGTVDEVKKLIQTFEVDALPNASISFMTRDEVAQMIRAHCKSQINLAINGGQS